MFGVKGERGARGGRKGAGALPPVGRVAAGGGGRGQRRLVPRAGGPRNPGYPGCYRLKSGLVGCKS